MSTIIRKVQLGDIAKETGVSLSGVSLAMRNDPRISEETRRRVQRAARKMGYAATPRQSATKKVMHFGFIYCDPSATRFDPVDFNPVLQLLMRDSMSMHARFELLLIQEDLTTEAARLQLLEFAGQLQGVLLFGMIHEPMLELLRQINVPAVVIGESDIASHSAAKLKLQRVTDDPARAGWLATDYLLRRGRRRIAFIGGTRVPGFYYDQWYRGFLLAHAEAGVAVEPRRVLWQDVNDPLGEHLHELLEPEALPDAIVYPDATIAHFIRPSFHRLGLMIPAADEAIGGMSHSQTLRGQEHHPQVLTDLAALTREAIRRLQAVVRHGADTAATVVLPSVLRNFEAGTLR